MSYQYAKGAVEKIEKWWEVERHHNPPLDRGATPLLERCIRVHGFSEQFALRVLKGYRQFMELKEVMRDWDGDKIIAPVAIQQMWEQHLIDIPNYVDDCVMLFSRVIGHNPDAALDAAFRLDCMKNTKIAMQARYSDDTDPEVWAYAATPIIAESALEESSRSRNVLSVPNKFARSGRLPVAGMSNSAQGKAVGSVGMVPITNGMVSVAQQLATSNSQQGMGISQQVSMEREARRMGRDRASLSPSRGRQLIGRSNDDDERSQMMATEDEEQRRAVTSDRGRNVGNTTPLRRARSTSRTPQQPKVADSITILLKHDETGEETYFSLRDRSTLRIVFNVFATRKNEKLESIRFSYNGDTLTGYETPYNLGLEDRARIDYSYIR